jgi:hypothetical protein
MTTKLQPAKMDEVILEDSHLSALSYGAKEIFARVLKPYVKYLEGAKTGAHSISLFPSQYQLIAMSIKRVKRLPAYPMYFIYKGFTIKPK